MDSDRNVPRALKQPTHDEVSNCKACIENSSILRNSNLAVPPPSTTKIAVTLDVMHQTLHKHNLHILLIVNIGEKMLRPSVIENDTNETSFNRYFRRFISIFNANIYSIVNRGTNLEAH